MTIMVNLALHMHPPIFYDDLLSLIDVVVKANLLRYKEIYVFFHFLIKVINKDMLLINV